MKVFQKINFLCNKTRNKVLRGYAIKVLHGMISELP